MRYRDAMAHHLELLACVARADGAVSVEEALAIRSFMDSSGTALQDVLRVNRLLDMRHAVDVEAVVRAITAQASPWTLAEAIRDAYVIASVDGEVSGHEIQAVERLFEILGLPAEHRAKLHRWARNAAAQQLLGMTFITASLDHVRAQTDADVLHDRRMDNPPDAGAGSMRLAVVKRTREEVEGD